MKDIYRIAVVWVSLWSWALGPTASAFTTPAATMAWPTTTTTASRLYVSARSHSSAGKRKQQQKATSASSQNSNNAGGDFDFLMDDFKTSHGELLNPYQVLKVSRDADRMQIKQAYRSLCRRYHPDGVRHRSILPGSCDNLQDVANHWERIKLSYEILQDPTRRKRYDRADVLSNPGLALRRAVGKAALDTVASLGKGMFGIGASVVQHVVNAKTTTTSVSVQQQQQQQQSSSSRDGSSSINSVSSNEQHVSKDQIVENV